MLNSYLSFYCEYFLIKTSPIIIDTFSNITFYFILFYLFLFVIIIIYTISFYPNSFLFILLFLFPILFIFIYAFDLFLLAFMLETLSISMYFLIALSDNFYKRSIEIIFKYFFVGAIATFLLLFGISILYGHLGSTSYMYIKKSLILNYSEFITFPPLLSISISSILISFMVKLGVFPFNWWVSDVYMGMSYIILLIYNTVIKPAIFIAFLKISYYLFFDLFEVQLYVYICCLGSIIYGCICSINQLTIKRFMAFTGINNLGWLFLGLSCGSIEGISSSLMYLFIYVIMNFIFWFTLLRLSLINKELVYFSDLNNIFKYNPLLGFCLILNIFSMSGIPPIGGFFAKYCLLVSAINSGMYFLVFISLFFSVISCFYYLKFIKVMFFDFSYIFYNYNFLYTYKINLGFNVLILLFIYILIFLGLIISFFYTNFIILSLFCISPLF